MKILALATIVAVAGQASARNIEIPRETHIPVCMESVNSRDWVALIQAKGLASKMFAAADVTIDWRSWNACPADGIRVALSNHTAESDHPHSYAYAMPIEGIHIVLFWDRIADAAGPITLPFLVAHVLVHEVTHILEGVSRHSNTGVMKAAFTTLDIGEMRHQGLPFAAEDLQLIHLGMKVRQTRMERPAGRPISSE